MNREPSNEPRVIDLLALERVSSEFETRESLREESLKRQQKAMKRRTTTAWKLLDIVHKLEEEAAGGNAIGLPHGFARFSVRDDKDGTGRDAGFWLL